MIVSKSHTQTRVAILEEGRLAEFYVEKQNDGQVVGNIYRARVMNVIPSMQAAFVDIGMEKNAFLYIDDALPSDWQKGERGKEKPNIRYLVQEGEERLVQVSKEGFGSKAPRVTTSISIPGRLLVYTPCEAHVSISRKIQRETERKRLGTIMAGLLTSNEGVIIRTQAQGASQQRLAGELAYLRSLWQQDEQASRDHKLPVLIHQAANLVTRVVRDIFGDDVDELVVDSLHLHQQIKPAVQALHPTLVSRVTFYQGKPSLFDAYGVEREVDKLLARQVELRNGGSIVIDRTEAMTVIDVNTGKFTGRGAQQLEETVTSTNIEAAKEIARQLRLRDIGGIIIIDFIDMKRVENQERVLLALQAELSHDKTTTFVLGITQLGLVEMTRKKERQSIVDTLSSPCPICSGKGRILSQKEAANRLEREVSALARSQEAEAVIVETHPSVAHLLCENGRAEQLESDLHIKLILREKVSMHLSDYRIVYVGSLTQLPMP